ncbi:MAG: efflux RND transporter periplasmic adaptor subunit [Deltaproteobacteria bacterium]|jgi:HlyD family secretion protein|nr:efflux RND transporter periplasmic adaptor subunit [Deltaproteobacteria bacterium]
MKAKVIIVLLILGLVVGVLRWRDHRAASERGGRPLVLYGNVDIRELTLSFRVPGRLSGMVLEEGDRVETGTIIAELDQKPFEDELAVRKAQLREAQAALINAEKKFERLSSLLKNKSVSQSDYDDTLALRDEVMAKVDTAQALVEQAQTNLLDSKLSSPSVGTVLTRVLEPGAVVAAGQAVYAISLDSPVWVRAYVEEPDLGRVHAGLKVKIKTDSGGDYLGQIGFISPKAEFTPKTVETPGLRTSLVYRLRVAVENPDLGLRQGMPVTVEELANATAGRPAKTVASPAPNPAVSSAPSSSPSPASSQTVSTSPGAADVPAPAPVTGDGAI